MTAGRVRSWRHWRAACLLTALAPACHWASGTRTPEEARSLLRTAIEAHGGHDRLAQFDDFRIVSSGIFKRSAPFRRTVHYRGAAHWSMSVTGPWIWLGMGVDEGRCWKRSRHRVEACSPAEAREGVVMAVEHNAWLLHRLDATAVQPAGAVRSGLQWRPAIRSADMVLAFDPRSHRLVQVRHGERVDELSRFHEINGAVVATRRVLTLDGQHDLEETWEEIVPGGADPKALRAPPLSGDGTVVEETDAGRVVAWTEIDDPFADPEVTVRRLDDFVRQQGRRPSASEGLIFIAPGADARSGEARWRLAVGVEMGEPPSRIEAGGMHLEAWPPARVIGVFCSGGLRGALQRRNAVEELIRQRQLHPAPAARFQVLLPRHVVRQPADAGLALARIEVR